MSSCSLDIFERESCIVSVNTDYVLGSKCFGKLWRLKPLTVLTDFFSVLFIYSYSLIRNIKLNKAAFDGS